MRIALAGGGQLALKILEGALEAGHEIVALVQDGRQTKGYKQWLNPLLARLALGNRTVMGLARMKDIPFIYIDKMTEAELAPLKDLQPDLLIVGGFSIILKKPILELPKIGCVNCHTALLPKHRGPHPCAWVLLQNEAETGITFHTMDEGIDTGDILAQEAIAITPRDTSGSLHMRLSELAGAMTKDLLLQIQENGLKGTPQSPEDASYEPKIKGQLQFLDWTDTAENLERKVRACFPYYIARFRDGARTVLVTRSRADAAPRSEAPGTVVSAHPRIKVATGQGTLELTIVYTTKPVPWMWPGVFKRVPVGYKLQ
ncbi:MAG: putative formyltransferase [Candidatus Hydrogenedentota bacterium]